MSNALVCRQCTHGRWRLSPRGQIKRQTSGTCAAQPVLSRSITRVGNAAPCLEVIAHAVAIWPATRAGNCPGFTLKEKT